VFFLHLFPQSRIVAVEPAPGNLAVLEKNLAPYGARAHVVRAAVWPTAASLQIERGFRDGLDWSLQVRPAETGTVPGVTVPRILERHHLGHVDLLKVDIEGAEYELFRGDTSWLDRVAHLCIELHHDAARCAFNAAISGYDCERDERGETTVCANLRVKER
jgi:FkbM family methyltransferase